MKKSRAFRKKVEFSHTRVILRRQYIHLITNSKLLISFKRDGFTVGDGESLISFIFPKITH